MQRLREVIRGSLSRSFRKLAEEDRLAAAMPLVCGSAMSSHCEVMSLGEDGTLHLRVDGPEWLQSLLGMREIVQHDLQRVAGVPLTGLHFVQVGSAVDRHSRLASQSPGAEPEPQRPAHLATSNRPRRPA